MLWKWRGKKDIAKSGAMRQCDYAVLPLRPQPARLRVFGENVFAYPSCKKSPPPCTASVVAFANNGRCAHAISVKSRVYPVIKKHQWNWIDWVYHSWKYNTRTPKTNLIGVNIHDTKPLYLLLLRSNHVRHWRPRSVEGENILRLTSPYSIRACAKTVPVSLPRPGAILSLY